MIKQTLLLLMSFMLLSFISCKATKEYTDYCAPLRTDNIQKITIEIQADSMIFFAITETQEMQDFINHINNSKVNGLWKGANWDKIVLHYQDGEEKVFNTNGNVFGQGTSLYFDLNEKYKHYWK